jgi:hypothetical protein
MIDSKILCFRFYKSINQILKLNIKLRMKGSNESFEQSEGVVIFGDEAAHESSGSLGIFLDGFKFQKGHSFELFLDNFFRVSFGVKGLGLSCVVGKVVIILDLHKKLLEFKVNIFLILRLGRHFFGLDSFWTGSWSALDCGFSR